LLSRLFWYIPNLIMLWWGLVTDRRVPLLARVLAVLGAVYFFSPVDAISDWLVPFGILDDLAVLYLSYRNLVKSAPREVVESYVALASGRRH
jgi:uncharacterized membrane protein YkvA (DUF1232 family)